MKCTSMKPNLCSATSRALRTALAGDGGSAVASFIVAPSPSGYSVVGGGSLIIFSAVLSQKFRNTRNFAPISPSCLMDFFVISQDARSEGVHCWVTTAARAG